MGKKRKKQANVFCTAIMLDGSEVVFQFPKDLRHAMLTAYNNKELSMHMVGALINVPTSDYKNGHANLHLAKIKNVFIANRTQKLRTRGQFLTEDNWTKQLDWSQIKFLLHDHTFRNKCRILIDLWRWINKVKKDLNP